MYGFIHRKIKKWATPTRNCSPIAVFLIFKQCKTARSIRAISYSIKKRQVAAPGCSPIVVFLISKQRKTARLIRAISYGIKQGRVLPFGTALPLFSYYLNNQMEIRIVLISNARKFRAMELSSVGSSALMFSSISQS